MELDSLGRPQLRFSLPNEAALDQLSEALARLLISDSGPTDGRDV